MRLVAALASCALLAAAAAPRCCDAAVVVKATNATAPSDVLGAHQTLVRTWTIYSTDALKSLTIQGGRDLFVDYDAALETDPAPALPQEQQRVAHPAHPAPPAPPAPPVIEHLRALEGSGSGGDVGAQEPAVPPPSAPAPANATLRAVAKVVVSGDNEELLNAHSVMASGGASGNGEISVVLSAGSSRKGGYALAQLFVVQRAALSKLELVSSGDVVVGAGVLAAERADANVTLSSIGSGDIFVVANETFAARSLAVETTGSGDVQLEFASVRVSDAISLSAVASGNIALLAERVEARRIDTTVIGSADLFVQARSVDATTIESFVGGSGSLTLSRDGTCVNQTVTIAGSGDVRTGSVACENVSVNIFGSGDAIVQARESLSVTLLASGHVRYVNAAPRRVVVQGSIFRKHIERRVKPAKENKFHVYEREAPPAREPAHIAGKKHHRFNWWGWFGGDDDDSSDDDSSDDSSDDVHVSGEPHHLRIVLGDGSSGIDIEIGDSDDDDDSAVKPEPQPFPHAVRMSASAPRASHGLSAPTVLAVVGVAMVGVGAAAFKYKQRRARQQYRPLF